MTDGIARWAAQRPDRPALVCDRELRTFKELAERHTRIAGLLASLGVEHADRIAVLSVNSIEMIEVTTGALRAGIVPVPVSPLLTPPEIDYLCDDSGAAVLFADRDVPGVSPRGCIRFGDDLERRLERARRLDISDVALTRPMHYTSGTTGHPKGVWVPPQAEAEAARRSSEFRATWGLRDDEVHLVCSPLTHSAPHRYSLRTLEAGGTVVVQRKFDARATLRAIGAHRVTSTFMVPTHVERILGIGRAAIDDADLSSMRTLCHAGAPIREATKRALIGAFPPGSVWEFYGSTEGGFTRISSAEWLERPGSVGRPPKGAELIVTDPEDRGPVLGRGEVGQIWLRDPAAERFEYWGAPAKTAGAWRGDAYSVGDLGSVDAGNYLWLAGRKHDVIISGGVNVYPQEVEHALLEHPDVAEAVVFGADHDEWGQQVRALIVPAPGKRPEPDVVREWARERLAGYKCPRSIELVESLPRTTTGKLRRRF